MRDSGMTTPRMRLKYAVSLNVNDEREGEEKKKRLTLGCAGECEQEMRARPMHSSPMRIKRRRNGVCTLNTAMDSMA
jgi:hypothetical protein